jgi:(p)ppGpp synthase/HD superfamily hydrolase
VKEPPVERPADQSEPPGFARPGLALEAWRFAAVAHGGQRRRGSGSPYIEHPVAVAQLVADHGGDEAMVAAAFLHDVLEDTDVASERIHAEFGEDTGVLVDALTDDRRLSDYEQRKAALRDQVERAGERAALVYAADKLANCRDLRSVYAREGEAAGPRFKAPIDVRVTIWRGDATMVERVLGPVALLEALNAALDGLEDDRARALRVSVRLL